MEELTSLGQDDITFGDQEQERKLLQAESDMLFDQKED